MAASKTEDPTRLEKEIDDNDIDRKLWIAEVTRKCDGDDGELFPLPVTDPPNSVLNVATDIWKRLGTDVYPPSDDSFLLVRAIEKEIDLCTNARIVLEIGSGSGFVAASCAKILAQECIVLAVDKNPRATAFTADTIRRSGSTRFDVIRTNLSTSLKLRGMVDILVFNPPYVVTPESEMEGDGISISWAGGKDGRVVIDSFLPSVADLLSESGLFFMVSIEENMPRDIIDAGRRLGLDGRVCLQKKVSLWRAACIAVFSSRRLDFPDPPLSSPLFSSNAVRD